VFRIRRKGTDWAFCYSEIPAAVFTSARCPFQHYDQLAKRAAKNGHVVDLFTCSLDQTGLHEMKALVNMTGVLWALANMTRHRSCIGQYEGCGVPCHF
jgi:hypothetical protein